jgi:hypothetical protein
MATFANSLQQSTNEIKTYTIDYTLDLPAAGTVIAGTATHTPPSGGTLTPTVQVSNPYVYATLPAPSVTGVHYLDVLATFNDGQTSSVRVPINVVYPAAIARVGMADIISDLRGLTDANVDDYTIAGNSFWSDAQLQRILDRHRTELIWAEMTAQENGDGTWTDYIVGAGNLEAGDVLIVQDLNGATVDSSLYTVDYMRGVVTFNADTTGTSYWVSARSYDLNGAASEIWQMKLGHYSSAVDFSTKVHSISRSQLYEHAKQMLERFELKSDSGFGSMEVFRSDTDC